MKHCHLYFTAKPLSVKNLILMCQNAFGQSDCRILQGAISQEKSETKKIFVCKLPPKFPTRKYYCVGNG